MSQNVNDDLINFDDFPALNSFENNNDDIFNPDFLNENANVLENQLTNDDLFGNNQVSNELILKLLSEKGISDPNKILIENEDGTQEEIDFNSLTLEEQLNIINNQEPNVELDDYEINVINFLRENNLTLEELIQHQINEALSSQNTNSNSSIDELNDEELYVLDLQGRFPDLSDEELKQELEKEKNSPDVFNKKMTKLREFYKDKEKQELEDAEKQSKLDEETEYQDLVNSMIGIANDTKEFFDLELEDSDKDDVLDCILTRDVNGLSKFVKMLNDPKKLFELAWFAEKGKEAFDTIHNYYKKEIDSVRKSSNVANQTSQQVVRKNNTKSEFNDKYGLNEYYK